MKLKTLKKKIRRLEKRLLEGPAKLAKWRRNLAAAEAKEKAAGRKRATARKTASSARGKKTKTAARKISSPQPKARRKLNLSPERRAELAEAMRARWAAKKAAAAQAETHAPAENAQQPS